MSNSSAKSEKSRARIPKDFPLTVHKGRGLWCKSIRGKRVYFEKVSVDPDGRTSLEQWLKWKDELIAGRPKPVGSSEGRSGLTVADLCNKYLEYIESRVETGELTRRYFEELQTTCKFFVGAVGRTLLVSAMGPSDFARYDKALGKRFGINTRNKRIIQIRSVFNFGVEDQKIPHLPSYGVHNRPPSAKELRRHRLKKGDQSYTREEILALLKAADINLKAWVLLGIQAGFSGADCRELPLKIFKAGEPWLDYPRNKTATARKVPLWPETLKALEDAVEFRGDHPSELLFISKRGNEYIQTGDGGWRVAALFKHLCGRANVECKGFHSLRRTFQTQADESLDFVAIKAVMGHELPDADMSAVYRQKISDARLIAVVEVVRQWLKPWEVHQ